MATDHLANIQQKVEVTHGGEAQNIHQSVIYQFQTPSEWRPVWHRVLKEWTSEDFQRFTRDLLQAEGFSLTPRNEKHLGFDKENHFLATKEMARGQTTWLVRCVHHPGKQLESKHADQIIQALKSYHNRPSIQGYRIITSGLFSRNVEDTLRSQLAGKKLVLWWLSEIEEKVSKEHPELLEKRANIQMPSKEESEFARHYELLNDKLFSQEFSAKAELFYRGNRPNWGIIQNGLDIRRHVELIEDKTPIRKTYDEIYQQILHLSDKSQRELSFVLLTAEAGSGKTTFLFRLGYDLYCHQDDYDRYWVMRLISDNLSPDPILEFYKQFKKHLYILVDVVYDVEHYQASLQRVMHKLAAQQDVSITIIVAVRHNEWKQKGGYELNFIVQRRLEARLSKLSEREANNLLDLLQQHGQLGELKNLSRHKQLQKLLSSTAADKQLLVALMEVTHGKRFEEILINEYQNLQPPIAQLAYYYVCLFHSYGILLPINLLRSALKLSESDFAPKIKPSTELVIIKF
ncbi:MAG: restriction endonuclease [Anaerolineae bacterium]